MSGKLYLVATPIGNLGDFSPRAVETLASVDFIAAEDTRVSVKLLNHFEIKRPLVSYHEHNHVTAGRAVLARLMAGESCALVTDAGTPAVSDPGEDLVRLCAENGVEVLAVPGCCAAVNALAISGFDLSSFLFYGFFPRENADRRKLLEKMRGADTRTFAFYESPKRIMELVDFLIESEAKLRLCLCNDMTKLHEMSFRGTPAQVKEQLLAKGNYDKGEYAIVAEVEPEYQFTKVEHTVSAEAMLVDAMISGGVSGRDAIAAVLADPNNSYSKNELKAAALNLKRMFE